VLPGMWFPVFQRNVIFILVGQWSIKNARMVCVKVKVKVSL